MASVVQPVHAPFLNRLTAGTLGGVAGLATSAHVADEAALARRAVGGDGEAFATLYERYDSRTYNLCFRILGSRDDAADATQEAFVSVLRRLPRLEGRELAFGSYVFTSARNACYDLLERRRRTEPSDDIPEHATPVGSGVGGGGMGFDPGNPEEDPERNVLLEARTDEIRVANLSLPERQREALALKELEDLSYDEIAEIMGMNRNSVAQLISRARINLRDALRGSALASIAPTSPYCERALPLIASLQDGQLDDDSEDAAWLGDHLLACDSCRLGREAMEEAGVSYRAWLPIAAGPLLFRETMAEAAELVGADWSDVTARREARRSAAGGAPGADSEGARAAILRHRRLDLVLMALLGLALVLVVFVGPTGDDTPLDAIEPAAEEEPAPAGPQEAGEPAKKPKEGAQEKKNKQQDADENGPVAAAPSGEDESQPGEEPAGTAGQTSAGTGLGGRRRRSSSDGRLHRTPSGGDKGGLTPDPAPEAPVPVEVTPEPPPPTDPAPTDPRVCRDPTTGQPIACGTQPPPPTCSPSAPNCPRRGRPPRVP